MLIAIDTGGTKTLVASFDEEGKLGESFRFPTPATPAAYIELISDVLIKHYGGHSAVKAIAIAIPGTIVGDVAIWCNNLHWHNFNAPEALQVALKAKQSPLSSVPIFVENDANLAGLGETRRLKTIPPVSLYVTVSTGVGTGITLNGRIDHPLSRNEGGMMHLEWHHRLEQWEDFASGKAIKQAYGKYARDITSKRAWNDIADRISRGLLALVPVIQPDIIIIGGSIGSYFDRYEVQLEKTLHKHFNGRIRLPVLVEAKHPEEAVLYGCYYYAHDRLATA